MNDYEKNFVMRMDRLRTAGLDFEAGTKAAWEAKFGGAAEVLLRDISGSAKREPKQLVDELNRIFGRGAMGFLDPVIKFADMGLFPPSSIAESPIGSVLRQLGPGSGEESNQPTNLLHRHRIKDEHDNYPDAYD